MGSSLAEMPRQGRVVVPNWPHHVIQGGHNKQVVFRPDDDYADY
jgi:putative transposase